MTTALPPEEQRPKTIQDHVAAVMTFLAFLCLLALTLGAATWAVKWLFHVIAMP